MRNLTIRRVKSFVACLGKLQIYMEDPTARELTINNTPCRKIGDLKNGEEKTFPIDERGGKVFVIADALSKDFCNEFYQLPEGQEDIFLSGKCRFNPANGNAFRFNNNESAEVAANRKHGAQIGLIVLIAAVVVGSLLGWVIGTGVYANSAPKEQTFSFEEMSITLPRGFKETSVPNFTVAYDSKNAAVFVLKEAFTLAEGFENYTVEEYANVVIQVNQLTSAEVKTVDGLTNFVYDFKNPETKETYRYFSYAFKTGSAFWLVQFTTLEQNADAYAEQIAKWAKSVRFSD